YAGTLPPEDQALGDPHWKRKYRPLREHMKVCTLATIYNISAVCLAVYLNTTTQSGAEEQRQFLSLFPALAEALQAASGYGAIRAQANGHQDALGRPQSDPGGAPCRRARRTFVATGPCRRLGGDRHNLAGRRRDDTQRLRPTPARFGEPALHSVP